MKPLLRDVQELVPLKAVARQLNGRPVKEVESPGVEHSQQTKELPVRRALLAICFWSLAGAGRALHAQAPRNSGTGFVVTYGPEIPVASYLQPVLSRRSGRLELIADDLNRRLRIPVSVVITWDTCRTVNAFYVADAGRRSIVLCSGLIDEIARWAMEHSDIWPDEPAHSLQAMVEYAEDALRFSVLHEVGHAVMDALRLPVLGRQEDAADEFAVWYMARYYSGGYVIPDWLTSLASRSQSGAILVTEEEAGGAHGIPTQRAFLVNCLSQGAFGTSYPGTSIQSTPGRTERECRDEWRTISATWERLLRPYLRP